MNQDYVFLPSSNGRETSCFSDAWPRRLSYDPYGRNIAGYIYKYYKAQSFNLRSIEEIKQLTYEPDQMAVSLVINTSW